MGSAYEQGQEVLRTLVCEELGIGKCTGKQLLRAISLFGLSLEEVDAAIASAQKLAPSKLDQIQESNPPL